MRRVLLPLAAVTWLAASPVHGASLWRPEGNLYGARTGFHAGDLVTIIVEEASSATHDWKAERNKEWQADVSLQNGDAPAAFAGNTNPLNLLFPYLSGSLDYTSDFKNDNSTDRSLRVQGRLTGQIVEILPNGNLRVEAKKRVHVNNEAQELLVRGLVRPSDVRPDNTVFSTALSEGEVQLSGSLAFRSSARNPISAFLSWLGNILF